MTSKSNVSSYEWEEESTLWVEQRHFKVGCVLGATVYKIFCLICASPQI